MSTFHCFECRKQIDQSGIGPLALVMDGKRTFHAECLELRKWRKESVHARVKRSGKAGHATGGRVIRSTRGMA